MSALRRGWSDTTPLLDQQHRSLSNSHTKRRPHSVILEMTAAVNDPTPSRSGPVFLGIDVGTGSARAGSLNSSLSLISMIVDTDGEFFH
ncbi:hypothetical protein Q3G72_010881 [Acer saccharum]|nr:hypothetical protein Q3G72_010881 [Acer saccharum]